MTNVDSQGKGSLLAFAFNADRNVISGNGAAGIVISGSNAFGNVVQGNLIGTDLTSTHALPNQGDGVDVNNGASQTQIGGTAPSERNVISGNNGGGVNISGAQSNVVEGDFVGTNFSGTMAVGNGNGGVALEAGATNNTIGFLAGFGGSSSFSINQPSPGPSDIISGNGGNGILIDGQGTTGNVVIDCYVGTDVTGTLAIPNSGNGVKIADCATGNTIGGAASADFNLISGNDGDGVRVGADCTNGSATGAATVVQGNFIGTAVSGENALGNGKSGVSVDTGANNVLVGGSTTGAGNLISGNATEGVKVSDADTTNVTIAGNFIGTDVTGENALGNGDHGIWINGATGVVVGGTDTGDRNLISANTNNGIFIGSSTAGALIEGNYIGTDVSGTDSLGNGSDGICVEEGSSGITVGGTTAGAGNVISGNGGSGVEFNGTSDNLVEGNFIGTDPTGTKIVGNAQDGVEISGGNNTVGGTTGAARNVIAGNTDDGVYITGPGNNLVEGNYIGVDASGEVGLGNGNSSPEVLIDSAAGNTIGGTNSGAGNVISGNGVFSGRGSSGLVIQGSCGQNNLVQGNFIGTDVNGGTALPNTLEGIDILNGATANTVGGTTAAASNVIAGNERYEMYLSDSGTNDNLIEGNFLGTNVSGTVALTPAGSDPAGVVVDNSASDNTIGGLSANQRNIIAGGYGVQLNSGDGNQVLGNYINVDASGEVVLGDPLGGISGSGSDAIIEGNVISGSQREGVYLVGATAVNDVISDNFIGTDATGTQALGNRQGIRLDAQVSGTQVIGNIISGNTADGIDISGEYGSPGFDNVIAGNKIGTDITGTKALGNGGYGIAINGGGNTVGGYTASTPNLIDANASGGILISGSDANNNLITGNTIGLDKTGAVAPGNGGAGITINGGASGNTISASVISANTGDGVDIFGAVNNVLTDNYIGTDAEGLANKDNTGYGVLIAFDGANNNTIGDGLPRDANIIAFNGKDGVSVNDASTGNSIRGNSMFDNGVLGISLERGVRQPDQPGAPDSGPNNLQVYPTIVNVHIDANGNLVLSYSVNDPTADSTYPLTVDFYDVDSPASGEGKTYLGTDTWSASDESVGIKTISLGNAANLGVLFGDFIVATATDANGNTSEFSDPTSTYHTFLTTNTGDSGLGSLRQAILDANATSTDSGANLIAFDIPGGGETITPLSALPIVTNGNLLIDGLSQPGSSANTAANGDNANLLVQLDGTNVIDTGLWVQASDVTIQGLVIDDFTATGIQLDGNQNMVVGDFVGTDPTGTAALGNGDGLAVTGAGNTIGGAGYADRNVIAGNADFGVFASGSGATGNLIAGNYIGTDLTGAHALANQEGGIEIENADGNQIGGDLPGQGNVISGNGVPSNLAGYDDGVTLIFADNTLIAGNDIGTDYTGTVALGNLRDGINVHSGSQNNTIGGLTAGARNIISANGAYGVRLRDEPTLYPTSTPISGNEVLGNYIGTDATGNKALGNGLAGVSIESFNTVAITANVIGGTAAGAANVIAGNGGNGVEMIGAFVTANLIEDNFIGTDVTGTAALANAANGVAINSGATDNTVSGNVISGNDAYGVNVSDTGTTGNLIGGNSIGTDVTGEHALANGFGGVILQNGATANTIGTLGNGSSNDAQRANVISGNLGNGITINNPTTSLNVVAGNYIGIDAAGTKALGNQDYGVVLQQANDNRIGANGSDADPTVERNVISGNPLSGVGLNGADGNTVAGNYLGTDYTGTVALGNGNHGVALFDLAEDNLIGTNGDGIGDAAERNVISGNAWEGIGISGMGTSANTIAGNYLGTDYTGTVALGNQPAGAIVFDGATGNVIGALGDGSANDADRQNVIAGNAFAGVTLSGSGTTQNVVAGNYIGLASNGAALGNGTEGVGVAIENGAAANTIGGTTVSQRNIISANATAGVELDGSDDNLIEGDYLGPDATGTTTVGSQGFGVEMTDSAFNTVGGTTAAARDVISGNAIAGVSIAGVNANGNVVEGDYIGTDYTGTQPLANGDGGVAVGGGGDTDDSAAGNVIGGTTAGARNVIAANHGDAVAVEFSTTTTTTLEGNFIGVDASGVKALGNSGDGVDVFNSPDVLIEANVIGGNGDGVAIDGAAAQNETVADNQIGTNQSGTVALGNHLYGVQVGDLSGDAGPSKVAIAGNLIVNNGAGVALENSSANTVGIVSGNSSFAGGNSFGGTTTLPPPGDNPPGGTNSFGGGNSFGSGGGIPVVNLTTGNVISGNRGNGITINGGQADANRVEGNFIGTLADGTTADANSGYGVAIGGGASGNSIGGTVSGAGNVIAYNTKAGIGETDQSLNDSFRGNSIFANGALGIDLGDDGVTPNHATGTPVGPNNFQDYPVLSLVIAGSQTRIVGTLADAFGPYQLDFYANTQSDPSGFGQGQVYLGSVTVAFGQTNGFDLTLPAATQIGQFITATATSFYGSTSEFSGDLAPVALPLAPVILGFSPETGKPGSNATTAHNLVLNGTALPNSTVTVFRDGKLLGTIPAGPNGQWTFDDTRETLPDGSYKFTATATDVVGTGPASAPLDVLIDDTTPAAPVIVGFSPDTGGVGDGVTSARNLTLNGTAEPGDAVELFRDGRDLGSTTAGTDGKWSFDDTKETLADGSYTFTAVATSPAGLQSPTSAPLHVVVDGTPPAAPQVLAISLNTGPAGQEITSARNLTLTGTAPPNNTVELFRDGHDLGSTTAGANGQWTFDDTKETLADGGYNFTATDTDAAGVTSSPSAPLHVLIQGNTPAVPQVLSISPNTGPVGQEITSARNLIVGGTATAGDNVEVFRDGTALGTTFANSDNRWSFDDTKETLADGTYDFTAVAINAAGVSSPKSAKLTVTVDGTAPPVPQVLAISPNTGPVSGTTTSARNLKISGTGEAGDTVELFRDGVSLGTTTAGSDGTWTFDDTKETLADGTYDFTATESNAAGETSSRSAALHVTVKGTVVVPPVVPSTPTAPATPASPTPQPAPVVVSTGPTSSQTVIATLTPTPQTNGDAGQLARYQAAALLLTEAAALGDALIFQTVVPNPLPDFRTGGVGQVIQIQVGNFPTAENMSALTEATHGSLADARGLPMLIKLPASYYQTPILDPTTGGTPAVGVGNPGATGTDGQGTQTPSPLLAFSDGKPLGLNNTVPEGEEGPAIVKQMFAAMNIRDPQSGIGALNGVVTAQPQATPAPAAAPPADPQPFDVMKPLRTLGLAAVGVLGGLVGALVNSRFSRGSPERDEDRAILRTAAKRGPKEDRHG